MTHSSTLDHGLTPFPTTDFLLETETENPTIDTRSQTVRGPICDIVDGKIMLAKAEEYRSHCFDNEKEGVQQLKAIDSGELTEHGRFVQNHTLDAEDDDQIQAFVRRVKRWTRESPEDMIRYKHARSWAPVALFFATTDVTKALVSEIDERSLRWS